MKNILKMALVAIFGLLMFSSCDKADDALFNVSAGDGVAYVQFSGTAIDFAWPSVDDENVPQDYSDVILVQILGPIASTDRVMNFSIDP